MTDKTVLKVTIRSETRSVEVAAEVWKMIRSRWSPWEVQVQVEGSEDDACVSAR